MYVAFPQSSWCYRQYIWVGGAVGLNAIMWMVILVVSPCHPMVVWLHAQAALFFFFKNKTCDTKRRLKTETLKSFNNVWGHTSWIKLVAMVINSLFPPWFIINNIINKPNIVFISIIYTGIGYIVFVIVIHYNSGVVAIASQKPSLHACLMHHNWKDSIGAIFILLFQWKWIYWENTEKEISHWG